MSIKSKLAQVEKLAGKVTLAHIKTMSSAELEAVFLNGLEREAAKASTPQHAELIRTTAAYLMSEVGLQNKNAGRLLMQALQNSVTIGDIPQ